MKKENEGPMGRRKFLVQSTLAAAALPLVQISYNQNRESPVEEPEEDSFEFAFLTDIHIKPEMGAPKGFQMAI
ncbi:MAG: hypothetical protein HKN31_03810, partial [Pricia sp.]|nr:hypothetical protein [Pricia sp.]